MLSSYSIEVNGLAKEFQIYEKPSDRLKQFLLPRIRKVLGMSEKNYYRSFSALKGVSFKVNRGETVGIVGRNGAGKSTLLQIICGTLNQTAGEVILDGRIAALLELGAGFNTEYTGLENVYLNASIMGIEKRELDQKLGEILDFAAIGDFIHQPIKTYSSGMVVRLAFAVAINVNPDVLIVDEALAVGDELFQRKCFAKIEEIKSRGATILFVSHSAATVVGLCDRAILIDGGELIAAGEPKVIVGMYQKLMLSTGVALEVIREEIKKELVGNRSTRYSSKCEVPVPDRLEGVDCRETYDPELVPVSMVEYASNGAKILDPHILKEECGRVNNLVMGERYIYRFKVSFERDCFAVRFGMLIKTATGIELGGFTTAKSASATISHVAGDSIYDVGFEFDCNLAPGTYFLNSGVSGDVGGEISYLHRLVDAAAFRVLPETGSSVTGMVDFNIEPRIRLGNT